MARKTPVPTLGKYADLISHAKAAPNAKPAEQKIATAYFCAR
jgi:hypothetical protein